VIIDDTRLGCEQAPFAVEAEGACFLRRDRYNSRREVKSPRVQLGNLTKHNKEDKQL
jgi:hypothetical protein